MMQKIIAAWELIATGLGIIGFCLAFNLHLKREEKRKKRIEDANRARIAEYIRNHPYQCAYIAQQAMKELSETDTVLN